MLQTEDFFLQWRPYHPGAQSHLKLINIEYPLIFGRIDRKLTCTSLEDYDKWLHSDIRGLFLAVERTRSRPPYNLVPSIIVYLRVYIKGKDRNLNFCKYSPPNLMDSGTHILRKDHDTFHHSYKDC